MNTNKNQLMTGVSHNPFALGMMRGMGLGRATFVPENDSGTGGDNTGGNGTGAGTGESTGDNGGAAFNGDAFWQDPVEKKPDAPSGGSDESGKSPTGSPQDDSAAFAQKLQNLSFGDVFTEADVRKMADEGDLSGINTAIQTQLKQAAHQSVVLAAELMQKNNAALMSTMKTLIAEALGSEKNEDTLLKSFPSASNPALRPLIQKTFDQALKHTGGDRTKAVAMAKDMLKLFGKDGAGDLGIDNPPGGPGDREYNSAGSKSLVDSLLQRN